MTQTIFVTSNDPSTARIVSEALSRLGHLGHMAVADENAQSGDLTLPCDVLLAEMGGGPVRLGALLDRSLRYIAHLRSMPALIEFAGLRLETGPCLLHKSGAVIRLTEKERDILLRLYLAGAQGMDRATLLEEVWHYQAGVETHTLETHIYRLRQKIEDDPAKPALLLTDQAGYVLSL